MTLSTLQIDLFDVAEHEQVGPIRVVAVKVEVPFVQALVSVLGIWVPPSPFTEGMSGHVRQVCEVVILLYNEAMSGVRCPVVKPELIERLSAFSESQSW